MSRILSGIRPSGELHLGNYLGAIKQWIDLQHDHETYFMVADLHAITTSFDPKTLPDDIQNVILDYLAAGLDPETATLFVQSQNPVHSELMWLLNTITPVGELQRMVQFKEKSAANKESNNAGILNYPILMAADILAYKAEKVPVGDDQGQHVELARDLAKKFNRLFGQTFPEPQAIHGLGRRIMDLTNPEQKMSKSMAGGIGLNDSEEEINKKLQKAVTGAEPGMIRQAKNMAEAAEKGAHMEWARDANLQKQAHGVRNLFTILFALGEKPEIEKWKMAAEEGKLQFSEFKPALAKIIADHFAPFREKRAKFLKKPKVVAEIIADGNKKARHEAEKTLAEAQQKMGLR
ncbi:MAG: tryptophan--tRNA ligase [Candidatus Kerfeldbacteria bacterium]|nr:tryptophan--tRNA ligase [Candidatus Kerfeldbacteria bacterium]